MPAKRASTAISTPRRSGPVRSKYAKRRGTVIDRIPRGMPFPKVFTNYVTYAEIAPVAVNGWGTYQFSCNNLYDPNQSGTGHQPMYYDELCAIYDHWCVESSSFEVQIANALGRDFELTAWIDDDTSHDTAGNYWLAAERPGAKTTYSYPPSGVNNTLRLQWNAQRAFGKTALTNPNFQGAVTTPPIEQQFYTMLVTDNGAATVLTFNIRVKITYKVRWSEFKSNQGS